MHGICNTRGDEGGRTGPLQIKTPIPGPSPKPEPPPYRGPRDQNPYLDDLAAKSAALDRNYQLEYSDTNLVSSVGNIRQCLCGCGRREKTALITDRLGFLYGEFDLDRGEMRNQIGYSVTLEPHFQKIASSGKVHNSAINALGNIEVRIRKTAFIENSSPSLIYSCGIVILGGVAEYTLTRIGSYEEDGEYVTLELDGCPNGWLSGLSYRIILGYNQDNSSLPFARWMSAVCDAPWFVYDMPNDCTYLRIEGLDWNAGIGTEYQISPRYLNDRYINLHGCSSLSFKIADSVEDSNPNNIVLIVEGNITQFLDDSPLIVIGCREIPHNPQYNTNGTYNFNGDTNLYGNLNRQYSPDTGSWTSIDPLGADSNGNYYSYGANSYDNGIDILGLQFTLPQRLINLTESQMEGEIVGYLKELKWTVVIDPSQNVSAGGSKADKGDKVITIGGRLHKNEDNNCGTRWGAAIAQVGFLVHELMEVFLTNEYEMPWQDHRTHNLALLFEMLHVADQLPRYSCRYHRNYHMCDWLERRSNAAGSKNSRAASYNAVKSLYKYLCGGKKPHGGDNQGKKPWEIPQNLKDLVEKQYGMKISGTVHSYQGGGVSSTWEIKGK
jgi:RHS repeat-associated protein